MKRTGIVLILFLAFCGLADSLYIAQNETRSMPLLCDVRSLSDCNIVAASQYSYLFGVPLAEYGVLFYALIFMVAALELVMAHISLRRILQGASLIGVAVSLYLTFLEVFVIRFLCIYCLVSALIALLILVSASFIESVRKTV